MIDVTHITVRQRAILNAIVEAYIATGEPVSSGAIAREGLSSATVRNEMTELVAAGLLEQPHTSAGRVPTARAFRMYVDGLRGGARIAPALLPAASRSQIELSFAGVAGMQALLERTSHVLASLSSGVGVAVTAITGGDLLEHVHFSRLGEASVLAVVVTRSGLVRDRVLRLDKDLTARELESAAGFLNGQFRGWSVERVQAELARMVERERSEYQMLMAAAQQLWAKALPEAHEAQTVYVDGVANLVGSEEDRERLRAMLMALEAKQRLIELLNAYVDARQESVRVVFDLEEHLPEMRGLVLIAAPAMVAGESRGTVGVLGPKRMHYENTMNAVSYIAEMFDRIARPGQV